MWKWTNSKEMTKTRWTTTGEPDLPNRMGITVVISMEDVASRIHQTPFMGIDRHRTCVFPSSQIVRATKRLSVYWKLNVTLAPNVFRRCIYSSPPPHPRKQITFDSELLSCKYPITTLSRNEWSILVKIKGPNLSRAATGSQRAHSNSILITDTRYRGGTADLPVYISSTLLTHSIT